jgi:hypothetical protein
MKTSAIALACLLTAAPALAKDLAGVKMPETQTLEGKELKLNGMGLRTKMIFKVYVAGLYVETPSKKAEDIISSDQIKRVDMHMLRDLGKGKIVEAIEAGFEKNAKDTLPALKDRLAKFTAQIPDLKEGQVLTIAYVPGKGTQISGAGKSELVIEGKDFADAMFSVWLGKNPVDDDLKKGMLGG